MNAARKFAEEANPFRVILDRWSPHATKAKVCHCRGCNAARKAPFLCEVCGYDGPPQVWACECPEREAERLAHFNAKLAEARDNQQPAKVRELEQMIEWTEKGAGHHRCNDDFCNTAHGYRDCPVCGIPDQDREVAAYNLVRDLRAALTAAGLV